MARGRGGLRRGGLRRGSGNSRGRGRQDYK
jgi:hypothetical protein